MASITSRSQDEGQSPASVREARVSIAHAALTRVPLVDAEEAGGSPALLPPSMGSQRQQSAGRVFKRANFRKAQRRPRFCTDYLPWLVAIISAVIFVALGVIVLVLPAFNPTTTTTTTATTVTTATTTTATTATTTTHTTTGSTTTPTTIRTSTATKTLQPGAATGGNLRSASNTPAPSTVDDLAAAVLVRMTVQQVDYEKLRSLGDVRTSFQREVATVIADQAAHSIDADAIEVKLAPGSVRVNANVPDLSGAEAMRLESAIIGSATTLTARLKSSIENVAGIDEALTGSVVVTNLEANAVAKTAPPAGLTRAQAAAWLFGIAAACCCPLLGLLIWHHRSWGAMGKGYMPAPLAASSTSKDETSDSKPLVTSDSKPLVTSDSKPLVPAATGSKGAGKPKAKVRKRTDKTEKTEKTVETEKTEKTEKTENTETTQPKADEKEQKESEQSQQPSQQPVEKKKRLVRAKRRSKPDESAREGDTASTQKLYSLAKSKFG